MIDTNPFFNHKELKTCSGRNIHCIGDQKGDTTTYAIIGNFLDGFLDMFIMIYS